jgi:hypothetical protein
MDFHPAFLFSVPQRALHHIVRAAASSAVIFR